jgi:uncharacterized protein (DUF1697 family)
VTSYVALLRAVNVSGQNKLAMADLRRHLTSVGYRDVTTYVQSGNVVFQLASQPEAGLVRDLEREIHRASRLDVAVLVRTKAQLREIATKNPFLRRGTQPTTLYVTFLARRPSAAAVTALAARPGGPDQAVVRGREVYLWCPGGYGRTKLNNAFLEKQLDVRGTTRNWKTVTTLLELVGG